VCNRAYWINDGHVVFHVSNTAFAIAKLLTHLSLIKSHWRARPSLRVFVNWMLSLAQHAQWCCPLLESLVTDCFCRNITWLQRLVRLRSSPVSCWLTVAASGGNHRRQTMRVFFSRFRPCSDRNAMNNETRFVIKNPCNESETLCWCSVLRYQPRRPSHFQARTFCGRADRSILGYNQVV